MLQGYIEDILQSSDVNFLSLLWDLFAGGGENGDIFSSTQKDVEQLNKPEEGSYEDLADRTGYAYLYTDLRSAPANSFLTGKFISYLLGYNKDLADWKHVVDGIFFIKEMKPVEH